MASPYPKPTVLKAIEGWRGHHPRPVREPNPDALVPRQAARLCPPRLQGEERVCWRREFRLLASHRVLTEMDLGALEMLAVVTTRRKSYQASLRKSVPFFPYPTGKKVRTGQDENGVPIMTEAIWLARNPLCDLLSTAEEMELKLRREFGVTPSARTKVSTVGASASDSIEEMLA